jgi:hypothetical protein
MIIKKKINRKTSSESKKSNGSTQVKKTQSNLYDIDNFVINTNVTKKFEAEKLKVNINVIVPKFKELEIDFLKDPHIKTIKNKKKLLSDQDVRNIHYIIKIYLGRYLR